MAYAVIKAGGKQFVVETGSTIRIPLIEAEAGKSIELDAMLTAGSGGDGETPVVVAA
jgi:large subunit ribosomal protein L21